MMRATTSVGPAGENGTINLTACAGYSVADSVAAFCAKLEPASTRAAEKKSRRTIVFICSSSWIFWQRYHCVAPVGSHQTDGCDILDLRRLSDRSRRRRRFLFLQSGGRGGGLPFDGLARDEAGRTRRAGRRAARSLASAAWRRR